MPVRDYVPEEGMGVRLNEVDLTRATEQTAILLPLVLGMGSDAFGKTKAVPTARRLAHESLLGYLGYSYCRGRIVHRDRLDGSNRLERTWQALGASFGLGPTTSREWALDFVVSPVDGCRSLLGGLDSGSISVLAAGPEGAFVTQERLRYGIENSGTRHQPPEDYLLLVTGPATTTNLVERLTHNSSRRPENTRAHVLSLDNAADMDVDEFLEKYRILESIQSATHTKGMPWTTSTLGADNEYSFKTLRPLLRRRSSTHVFTGSSVAAALAVLFPKLGISLFCGIVRATHVMIIAAAAQVTDGHLVAIPVLSRAGQWDTERRGPFYLPGPKTMIYQQADFIIKDDIFVIATGITETPVLRGVRFQNDLVSTHTLCLRARTRTARFISNRHLISAKTFRFLSPDNDILDDALATLDTHMPGRVHATFLRQSRLLSRKSAQSRRNRDVETDGQGVAEAP